MNQDHISSHDPNHVAAYLIEWLDMKGNVVRLQTSSEFPMTMVNFLDQRIAAKVIGNDFQDAHEQLLEMISRIDKKLSVQLRHGGGVVDREQVDH